LLLLFHFLLFHFLLLLLLLLHLHARGLLWLLSCLPQLLWRPHCHHLPTLLLQ
jgi:hypothetical protein